MATNISLGGCVINVSTTAGARDWTGRIESTLTAGGWVQTSDTGQTAAASMPVATGAAQILGYQIWRMGDSLQSASPLYMKIEFASTASGATVPAIWFTMGTGTDGTGTVTGIFIPRISSFNISISGNATAFVASAASNRFSFFLNSTSTHHILFSIERTKNSMGADTADGFLVILDSYANVSDVLINKLVRVSGNTPANSTLYGIFVPSGNNWVLGTSIGVCPVRFFDGQPTNPGISWLCYLNADIPANSTVSSSIYGTSHTYFALGNSGFQPSTLNTTASFMMIYE